jgi:hypothetical protein
LERVGILKDPLFEARSKSTDTSRYRLQDESVFQRTIPQFREQVPQGFDKAKKCVEDGRSRLEQLIKTA